MSPAKGLTIGNFILRKGYFFMNPYAEDKMVALPYRRRMLDETNAYITVKYRNDLIKMLGKPLTDRNRTSEARQ